VDANINKEHMYVCSSFKSGKRFMACFLCDHSKPALKPFPSDRAVFCSQSKKIVRFVYAHDEDFEAMMECMMEKSL